MADKKQVIANNQDSNEAISIPAKDITEISEDELEQVSGGSRTQDVTVNKHKTADKIAAAVDAYIKG